MILRSFLLVFSSLFLLKLEAQKQAPLKDNIKGKLDNAWFGSGTFSTIRNNRDTCTAWVRRLKSKDLGTDEFKSSYEQVKSAYDAVLDIMIEDVNKANSVGEVYQFFVKSKDRKNEYAKLCGEADGFCAAFINSSMDAYSGENMGSGLIAQFIFTNFVEMLVPDIIQKIAEVFRDALKEYYVARIDSLRFEEWDRIR